MTQLPGAVKVTRSPSNAHPEAEPSMLMTAPSPDEAMAAGA